MNIHKKFSERGQILLMFAVLAVGLLALLALAIDGGFAYAARRAAQNAADAGALAGARYECDGYSYAVWTQKAKDYVQANHDATPEGVGNVGSTTMVWVKTSLEYPSFFARILGFGKLRAEAYAEAGCFTPAGAAGALPVGWSCKQAITSTYTTYSVNTTNYGCDVRFPSNASDDGPDDAIWDGYTVDPYNPPGPDTMPLYVVMDSFTSEDDYECAQEYAPYTSDPAPVGITLLDCDLDDDGILDSYPKGARSWLDLNGDEGNTNDLSDWIKGTPAPEVYNHTWLPAVNGVSANLFKNVNDYLIGKIVLVPVYDAFCEGIPSTECPGKYHIGSPQDKEKTYTAAQWLHYHVVGFAFFQISCVQKTPNAYTSNGYCPGFKKFLEDNDAQKSLFSSTKAIEGFFVPGYNGGLFGKAGPGDGGTDMKNYVIYLNK